MIFTLQRLFRTIARLDESVGEPPWPLQVWNPDTQTWDQVGTVIAPEGVLYERVDGIVEFVLTSEGDVIGL